MKENKRHLRDVLNDIMANNLRITQYVADNPKRSEAKECKCFSAWYPCEYCFAKGCKIEIVDNCKAKKKISQQINLVSEKLRECESEPDTPQKQVKINNLKSLIKELKKSLNVFSKKSNILWPYSTMEALHRSRQSILEIVQKIENEEILSIDESKGVVGRSLLLDLPNFNFIYDVPAEYLHSGCLGVIKRLVQLTFGVGPKRPTKTKRKLASIKKFNKSMLKTKVTKECSRRSRKLDFSVFKGQEYRNLLLFFWPLIIDCLESDVEKIIWMNLVYMIRASVIPSEEFSAIPIETVQECCKTFYRLFEEVHGITNCTYNLHVLCCHLLEIRTHGPLTETSAFKFESFYGEVRRSFVPGTGSPLKQILKKITLKRNISKHFCKSNISITNYNTPMEWNNLIYCYKNNQYLIYQVKDIENEMFSCNKIGQYPVQLEEIPHINWSKVGVFKKGGVCSEITEISSSEIGGKVFHVGKYLITCPINVLNEK